MIRNIKKPYLKNTEHVGFRLTKTRVFGLLRWYCFTATIATRHLEMVHAIGRSWRYISRPPGTCPGWTILRTSGTASSLGDRPQRSARFLSFWSDQWSNCMKLWCFFQEKPAKYYLLLLNSWKTQAEFCHIIEEKCWLFGGCIWLPHLPPWILSPLLSVVQVCRSTQIKKSC